MSHWRLGRRRGSSRRHLAHTSAGSLRRRYVPSLPPLSASTGVHSFRRQSRLQGSLPRPQGSKSSVTRCQPGRSSQAPRSGRLASHALIIMDLLSPSPSRPGSCEAIRAACVFMLLEPLLVRHSVRALVWRVLFCRRRLVVMMCGKPRGSRIFRVRENVRAKGSMPAPARARPRERCVLRRRGAFGGPACQAR